MRFTKFYIGLKIRIRTAKLLAFQRFISSAPAFTYGLEISGRGGNCPPPSGYGPDDYSTENICDSTHEGNK